MTAATRVPSTLLRAVIMATAIVVLPKHACAMPITAPACAGRRSFAHARAIMVAAFVLYRTFVTQVHNANAKIIMANVGVWLIYPLARAASSP